MIVGYNFFSKDFHGTVYDTAIPTSEIDEVIVGPGIWDEIFVSVDTAFDSSNQKPDGWRIRDIMDAKFQDNLEAGNIGASGHVVTTIQIYRRNISTDSKWLLLGDFPYDESYNLYSFVDRLAENGASYQYAIVPVADKVMGDITISQLIDVDFTGVWLSDLQNNFQLEYDFTLDDVTHNRNMSAVEPINGKYPIITFGAQNYRTGGLSFLPLSKQQIDTGGCEVNGREERIVRESVVNFLNRGSAKVIRNDNGSMMVVVTHDVAETSKQGKLLDISSLKFNFTEVGELDYETMSKGGLLGEAIKSKYTFDENGEVEWQIDARPRAARALATPVEEEREMRPRNTFSRGSDVIGG